MAPQVAAVGAGCMRLLTSVRTLVILTFLPRFIIDGIITMPIALYGFLIFPDVPATTNVFYLSKDVSKLDLRSIRLNFKYLYRNDNSHPIDSTQSRTQGGISYLGISHEGSLGGGGGTDVACW